MKLRRTATMICSGLLVLGLLTGCRVPELKLAQLRNASFDQPLDSGWTREIVNDVGTRGFIERSDSLGQPDSGWAVRVFKLHRQYASLSQTVELETLAQEVSWLGRFRLGGSVPCVPVAAVAFSYLDRMDQRLGRTLVCLPSQYATLASSESLHVVRIPDTTGQWSRYRLNLKAELDTALAGIDQARVARLRVELLAWVEQSG